MSVRVASTLAISTNNYNLYTGRNSCQRHPTLLPLATSRPSLRSPSPLPSSPRQTTLTARPIEPVTETGDIGAPYTDATTTARPPSANGHDGRIAVLWLLSAREPSTIDICNRAVSSAKHNKRHGTRIPCGERERVHCARDGRRGFVFASRCRK